MDKIMKILDDFWYDIRSDGPGHGADECLNRAYNKFEAIWNDFKLEARQEAIKELQDMLKKYESKNPIL